MLLVVLVGNKGIINVHHPGRSHEFCYSCALGPDFRYCNQRGRRLRWSCEGMLSTKIWMTIVLIPSLPSKLNKGKWVLLSLSLRNNNNHYLMSVFFNCQALSNVHFLHFFINILSSQSSELGFFCISILQMPESPCPEMSDFNQGFTASTQ